MVDWFAWNTMGVQSPRKECPNFRRKLADCIQPRKSVMAWIEDSAKGVLLVRQATGSKLWTFPGGKVKRSESLMKALKREVHEETGLRVQIGSLLGVLDWRDKDAITLMFACVL